MDAYLNIEVLCPTEEGDNKLRATGKHGSLTVTLKPKIPAEDQAKLLAEIYCEKHKLPPPGSLTTVSSQHWQVVRRTASEELKSKSISALVVVLYVALLISGLYIWDLWGKRPPAIPSASETVEIVLHKPGPGKVIVEKTIEDDSIIQNLVALFSQGKSCSDHKCASIGDITFVTAIDTKVLNVLPGHDDEKYEFRYDGRMFCVPRNLYVSGLVAAGIKEEDVRLDGH